ncbi:MAG TPA: DUF3775 domain-containing protein [Stellaceae bacterium]|nr:DUF3775 domain-containing protein [Stellaceae bacterium]
MTITLDTRGFADLKRRAHAMAPQITSSKLAEVLSAGLGYSTHAALIADMSKIGWIEREVDDAKAAQRAAALGVAARAGLMAALEAQESERPVSLTAADVRDIIRLAETCNREDAEKMRNLDGSGVYTMSQLQAVGLLESSDAQDALVTRIGALTRPALMELITLVWIGRDGDEGDVDDWQANLAHAYERSDEGDVIYIAEKRDALPRYLAEGMRLIPLPH